MFLNSDALITSNKALSIIFIILICLINFPLIYQQVRKPLFYQNVKWMTIISLAIGDVILALFPLVVMAKQYFDPFWLIPCRLGLTYIIYISYLVHFVYGMGVIVLGADVLLRHKLQANGKRTMTALFVSSLPWILGLIIILPLGLVNVDYYRCYLNQSPGALFGVSVLFPASLAFVATLLLNCKNLSTSPPEPSVAYSQQNLAYSQQSVAYSQQSVAYTQENVALPVSSQAPYSPQIHGNGTSYPHNIDPYPHHMQYPPNPPPPYNAQNLYQPHPQYPYSHQGQIHQYDYNQLNAVHHAPTLHQATNQGTSFGVNLNSNRRKDAHWLVVIVIIYCAMVVPFAAFSLSDREDIYWQDTVTITIVRQCLYWLSVARSCVTPLFMFHYSRL